MKTQLHQLSNAALLLLVGLACQPNKAPGPKAPALQESEPTPKENDTDLLDTDLEVEEMTKRVVLTIDDLPLARLSSYSSAEERHETVTRLTEALSSRGAPFVAFYNLSQHEKDPALLPLWEQAGATAGNHTWSHPHPSEVGLKKYLKDLKQGHEAVAALPDASGAIPFRYPYLYEGFPCEEAQTIAATLRDLGSYPVPVTIDTWDWYYSKHMHQARLNRDEAAAEAVKLAYIGHFRELVWEAEQYAERLFGRQPPQILLLHGNRINAELLGELLDWMTAQGYAFITLDEALADEAYAPRPYPVTPRGISHWKRLLRLEQGLGRCEVEP